MLLKMNSLEDTDMIEKLYEASKAGVKITIITRGICSLVAGVEGVSDNIQVLSIVDRFLEHARIFMFNNGGKEEIYLSSADWMNRNLSHRVETAFPVYAPKLRQIVRDVMDLQLKDNVKARILSATETNVYKTNDEDIATRAQVETYFYFKKWAFEVSI